MPYDYGQRIRPTAICWMILYQDEKVLSVELKPREVRLSGYEKAYGINSLYSSFNDVV